MYLWDTCYKDLSDCSFRPISERKKALKGTNHKVPPTFKEIQVFERSGGKQRKIVNLK